MLHAAEHGDDRDSDHRRARRHEASDRRLRRRDRLRAAAELRDRPVRARALQPRDRRRVPRHRPVFPRRSARVVGEASLQPGQDPDPPANKETTVRETKRRIWLRSVVGAAAATALMGSAWSQETLKIGLPTNPEGPFAVPGQDGFRGADMALKEKNGMAGGKKIEFVKVSSDACLLDTSDAADERSSV